MKQCDEVFRFPDDAVVVFQVFVMYNYVKHILSKVAEVS